MRLALSSAALPGCTPAEMARACSRRGLHGIELVLDARSFDAQLREWRALDVPVVALRAASLELATSGTLAKIAGILEAPVVTPPELLTEAWVAELAPAYAAFGATLLLGVRTNVDQVRAAATLVERVGIGSLGLAWEIRPFDEDLGAAPAVLRAGTPHVLHIRLSGGGPEQREQDGRGLGSLFVDLALARYDGALAITPSSPDLAEIWARWSTGKGASGCGSRAHARERETDGRVELDVRPVEPKDRIDTVLRTFDGVRLGGTMRLIVDHDPDCMRHLLTATQPPYSFTFAYLERGPEVWRVDVVRRA